MLFPHFLVVARAEPFYPFIGFNGVCLVVSISSLLSARYTEPGLLITNPPMGSIPTEEFKYLVKRALSAVCWPEELRAGKGVTVNVGGKTCSLQEARAKICGSVATDRLC